MVLELLLVMVHASQANYIWSNLLIRENTCWNYRENKGGIVMKRPLFLRHCFNNYFLIRCPFSLIHISSVQFIGYKLLGLLHNSSYSIVCYTVPIPLFWCILDCFQFPDSNYLSKLLVALHCYSNDDPLNNFRSSKIFNINFIQMCPNSLGACFLAAQCVLETHALDVFARNCPKICFLASITIISSPIYILIV